VSTINLDVYFVLSRSLTVCFRLHPSTPMHL